MTKMVYPSDGLNSSCRKDVRKCARYISGAISNSSFSIPAGFTYSNYLAGLSDKLEGYLGEAHSIGIKMDEIDRDFASLTQSLEGEAGRIVAPKITKRERMVV